MNEPQADVKTPQLMEQKPAVIGVYLPTRGRQHLAVSTLNAWAQLAGDPANIKFLIGIDEDDQESAKIIPGDSLEVHIFDKSIISCGARNKALADKLDADIYLLTNDYYYPMSQYWDNTLRQTMAGGNEVLAFQFAPNPAALHTTATTRRWMDYANQYEPTLFPFWFSDQWRVETYSYVFNIAPQVCPHLMIGAKQAGTQNMRELDFWWGLFTALRPVRLRQAYEIYKKYGMTAPTFEDFVVARRSWIDQFMLVDLSKRKQFIHYQAHVGDQGEPGERYKTLKANAEKFIVDEGLTPWESRI